MNVREALADDSARLLDLFQTIHSESTFMRLEPEEMTITEEQLVRRLEEMASLDSGAMFVCEAQHEFIGVIFGFRGILERNRHSLNLAIGVRQAWVGQGVGFALMKALEAWARSKLLHRIDLTVDVENQPALALYEKCGFEREGLKRHSVKIDEKLSDELIMSKLIEY
jgi:RimJ/RimL family protein N-acetyltransferase